MGAGIQSVNRQDLRELRHSVRGFSVDPFLEVAIPIRDAELPHTCALDGAKYCETVLAVLNETTDLPGAKGPPATEHEHPFEQAGLAGAVRTEDVVSARIEGELDVAETSQRRDSDSAQRQG
jgi:hypothetical protein